MRTTLTINDALYEQAKTHAMNHGSSVGAIFEEALRVYLNRFRLLAEENLPELPVFDRGELQPGVDLNNGSALRAFLDQEASFNALR